MLNHHTNDGVVQLHYDGRLLVFGDIGELDLVKFHHLRSHLFDQDVVDGQDHFAEGLLAKGGWGQLVVAD